MQLEHTDLNSWKVLLVSFFFWLPMKVARGHIHDSSWWIYPVPGGHLVTALQEFRKFYVTFLHYSWQTMHWRLKLLKTHTQQTYQRAMLFQFFDCNCPTVITMLWIIKNNSTCIFWKRIIFFKVTIKTVYLTYHGRNMLICFFPMLYAKRTHYTGYRWIWALDQNELTVLAYDKSPPINNMIQKKLQTNCAKWKPRKKRKEMLI